MYVGYLIRGIQKIVLGRDDQRRGIRHDGETRRMILED
jgi:hypothetical protein